MDFEKAFDNINWGCVDIALEKFGFGHIWRSWIKLCISYARFQILLNGEATSLFKTQKGMRQGDPISPFLFIIVAEILSLMIKRAASSGLISGFKVSPNGTAVQHLQFADGLIVFLDDTPDQVSNLKNIIFSFELISGLKVNFRKSTIVGIGTDHNGADCARIFGCSLSQWPLNYLGIPLGCNSKCKAMWEIIVQKFHQKLSTWKGRYFSKDQRLIMTKAVISKKRGGIGVKKLKHVNKALHSIKSSLWDGILKAKDHVLQNTSLNVASGDRIMFWKEKWKGDYLLKVTYNSLYKLSRKKLSTIKDCISDEVAWNLDFTRNLNASELGEVVLMLQELGDPAQFSVISRGEDQRKWIAGGGDFTEWPTKRGKSMHKKLWGLLAFAIWWNIWTERNNRLYGNKRRGVNQLIIDVKCTLFNWCRSTKIFEKISLSTIICNGDAILT
ncbi:uncharacterized protein LOC113305846 [Papaver somniferum]|uniref:uncharacterized protein LOC113305846 n=1 Tax=Papaver somniferum TaxID=3469 RepID=UPI000E6F7101|nr:uncharacterized protein LOC113305846 [Papaver somniferum]